MPWFTLHNPLIDWTNRNITFSSLHCRLHCLKANKGYPIIIEACEKPNDDEKPISIDQTPIFPQPRQYSFQATSKRSPKIFVEKLIPIGAIAFNHLAYKRNHLVFTVSLRDIEQALRPKPTVDPATILPKQYHQFLSVFNKSEADKLPLHRPGVDHTIKALPGTQPPSGPLYGMSREELEVLKKYLEENLDKGFIRASSSPAATPVLFVKKPGGGLRFCVDYRGLNAITIKNKYSLPLIRETLDRLCKAVWFSKLDIVAAFNQIRMAAGEE